MRAIMNVLCVHKRVPVRRVMGYRTGALQTCSYATYRHLVNKVIAASGLAKYVIVIYLTYTACERHSFSHTTTTGRVGMRHLSATMSAKNTLWMSMALAAGIVAAWLVVVLATPTKPAEAAFPGNNGKIVFVSQRGGSDAEIVTIKANGDNETNLTNNGMDDFTPAFSANGKKIVFASNRSGNREIFTMSADGTHQKNVTRSASFDSHPAWSPDGTKIAFSSSRNGNTDIFVINQDATGLTRITTSPKADTQPAWSPDGTMIAFSWRGRIFVMKAAPVIRNEAITDPKGTSSDSNWQPLR